MVEANPWVLSCRRDWCTSQNRWHQEAGIMWIYWSNISRHLSGRGRKWVFQMNIDPKHTSKVVGKWLQDNKVKVLVWPSQIPDLNPIEHLWAELKKHVRARRPTNLTQLHQLCQEEWAKIHPTYCGKVATGYPKRLTQVKQFKRHCSQILIECM